MAIAVDAPHCCRDVPKNTKNQRQLLPHPFFDCPRALTTFRHTFHHWVLYFSLLIFLSQKHLIVEYKLDIIHKITLKDTCTYPSKKVQNRPSRKFRNYFLETLLAKPPEKNDVFIKRYTMMISAPLFDCDSDKNFDVEGVKQEFDALRNGHFDYDCGSEFYFAGEIENSCYSKSVLKILQRTKVLQRTSNAT